MQPNQTTSEAGSGPLDYTDYRSFLIDHARRKRAQSSAWSYTVWARQLGLRSSSTLIMILNGQRNPGPALTAKLCRYFRLNARASAYFHDLVRLEKTRADVQAGMGVLRQLEQRHPGRGFRLLDRDTFLALSQWHCFAIRELVNVKGFREDPEWIARQLQFPVPTARIEEALATLLRLGLIERGTRGQLSVTSRHLDTKGDQGDAGLLRYHEQLLAHASESLRTQPSALREISGGCFAIRERDLPRAKELIRSFQVELCNALEAKGGDRVYQIETAFFPLSKSLENQP